MEGDIPVTTNNSKIHRLNFVELRYNFKLIPSLILPLYSFNCSNILINLGITNVCSLFAYSLQRNYITKYDISTLPPIVNLNMVNNSSFNLVTIFTSFSSIKRETIHDSNSSDNQFTSFSDYLPSSIFPDPFINITTVPSKMWGTKVCE